MSSCWFCGHWAEKLFLSPWVPVYTEKYFYENAEMFSSALHLNKADVFTLTAQTKTAHFWKQPSGRIPLKTKPCLVLSKHQNWSHDTKSLPWGSLKVCDVQTTTHTTTTMSGNGHVTATHSQPAVLPSTSTTTNCKRLWKITHRTHRSIRDRVPSEIKQNQSNFITSLPTFYDFSFWAKTGILGKEA